MRQRVFYTLWALVFQILAPAILVSSALAAQQDIKVLEEDAFGLVLECRVPSFEVKDVQGAEGENYQKVVVPGWSSSLRPGFPDLPASGALIQVPAAGSPSLQVIDQEYAVLPNHLIAPIPLLTASEDGKTAAELIPDPGVYLGTDFFPSAPAQIAGRGFVRGVPVARVLFHPFQWSPVTKELRYSKRIKLRVWFENPISSGAADTSFRSGSAEAGENPLETVLEGAVLNFKGATSPFSPSPSMQASPLHADSLASPDTWLRVEIKEDGIYRLTYGDLSRARINPSAIDPRTFQLFNRSSEVSILVVTKKPGIFTTGDYIEFFAKGASNAYTDTNVYRLFWGNANGRRVQRVQGRVTGTGEVLGSFSEALHIEQDLEPWERTPGAPDQDYWFWQKLTAPTTQTYHITLPSSVVPEVAGRVRIGFRGRSTAAPHPDHHTRLYLNGRLIGDQTWDGDAAYIQTARVPASLFKAGDNVLQVEMPGDTGAPVDIAYLNWIEAGYTRRLEADQDELTTTVAGGARHRLDVTNLSSRLLRIYDITNPLSAKLVVGASVAASGDRYTASFEAAPEVPRRYYTLTTQKIKKPFRFTLSKSANLKGPENGADYILITDAEFTAAVQPLLRLRRYQGLRAVAVSVQSIYDEFNYGQTDPAAIRDFLQYAYEQWVRPAPAYVLLFGDANTDYRDHLGTGKKSRVPVHLSFTSGLGLTPDDGWYACVLGDDVIPEMMIGRLPARDVASVTAMVNKVMGFERSTSFKPRAVLFAADNDDPAFEALDERLSLYLPSTVSADKVYLGLYGGKVSQATQDIISSMDRGVLVTNYVGHGAITNWAGEYLFDSSDVYSLNNGGRLSFAITMDCLNGYFSSPMSYSLSEELVAAPDRGTIASFSPSGLGYPNEHEILSNEVFSTLFEQKQRVLGAVTTGSKIAAYARGVSDDAMKMFNLIGDPAVKLKRWW